MGEGEGKGVHVMGKCAFCKQTVTQSLKELAFPMSKVKQHTVQSPKIVG